MHARKVYWKEWAAKHEHEKLKDGVWVEHIQALFRNHAVGTWTGKHLNRAIKIVIEEGWT